MNRKKILVIYYTQTGQMRRILDSICAPLIASGAEITCAEIRPDPPFPFPWRSSEFFDAFPESFMGIPCVIKDLEIPADENYDLVLLGYSPWYLSPSIPVHSFLQSEQARALLKGKNVITVIGCRNMWLQSQEKIKKYLLSLEARLVGNVALRDRASNLTSVLTIIRWLIKGKQEKSRFLPRAGVSDEDIRNAQTFGNCILKAVQNQEYSTLQAELAEAGAVTVKPNLVLFERNGSKIFRMFSSRILKKGPHGDPRRKSAVRLFKYYLLMVLFVISPLGSGVYFFIKPFIREKIRRDRRYFSQNDFGEND